MGSSVHAPQTKAVLTWIAGCRWTMMLLEPFQVTAISSRVIAILYGFVATVLVNTCEWRRLSQASKSSTRPPCQEGNPTA